MKTFCKLFGNLLILVYHCFDRMVIQGYLPLMTRPEHIVHFFRDVHGVYPITKEVLRKRTDEYNRWVEAFARKPPHSAPMARPEHEEEKHEEAERDPKSNRMAGPCRDRIECRRG